MILIAIPITLSGGFCSIATSASEADLEQNARRLSVLGLGAYFETFQSGDLQAAVERQPSGSMYPFGREELWVWRDGDDLMVGLDENHDRARGSLRPDSLDDVTLVDYDRDGTVDRVLDWRDLDHDGRADQQVIYTLTPGNWSTERLACVVVEQYHVGRRFWHLERYQYIQSKCQWKTDFGGSGFFTAAYFDETSGRWHSFEENPFCFYDNDGDGLADEALRIAGRDRAVESIRWSWDADRDATPESPYDYDLSITAVGKAVAPAALSDSVLLRESDRDAPAMGPPFARAESAYVPIVSWKHARAFAKEAVWKKALLCVDENDENVAAIGEDRHERWEGVIAEEAPGFMVVGGPPTSPHNKRYELDRDASGRLDFYVGADLEVHLRGAEAGWVVLDEDADPRRDAVLRMEDRDEDGLFETWLWDADADKTWERTCLAPMQPSMATETSSDRSAWLFGEFGPGSPARTSGWASADSLSGGTPARLYRAKTAAWRAGRRPWPDSCR